MKKFIPLFIVILVSLISCREDNEVTIPDNLKNKTEISGKTALDEKSKNENALIGKDSIILSSKEETDPPVKNGDHWRP